MTIDNTQNIIDSRDIIERIEELESEIEIYLDEHPKNTVKGWEEICPHESLELDLLKALADEASGYSSDWRYGEALIRDSYFTEYAQELAEDCGMVNSEATWLNNCIDWDRATSELQHDYTSIDFDGVTYWIRAC